MTRKLIWLGVLVSVLALMGGAGLGSWLETRSAGPAEFIQQAAPAEASPIKVSYSGTGTFRVPDQFPPGTYMVTAGAGDFGCYFERLRRLDNREASVISHGQANRGGYGRLIVTAKDAGVRMIGDCVWIQI